MRAAQSPPSPHLLPLLGAPRTQSFPSTFLANRRTHGSPSQIRRRRRGRISELMLHKQEGVATNNQAPSFSGGPHELSHRACPQELLPYYQLGPDGRRGASCPPHPTSNPRPSCTPLTYTSAFATCLGAGLFPAQTWRVFSFLLRCASSLQPQLQSLLLRRGILLLPPLPAIPASELARVFGAARRAGHGSRGLCLHLGKRKDSAVSRTQRPVGGRWGF